MATAGNKTFLRCVLPLLLLLLLVPFVAGAKGRLPKAILWKNIVRCNVEKVEVLLSTHVFDHRELGKALWMAVGRATPDNHEPTLLIVHLLLDKGAEIDFGDVYERTSLMLASENLDEPLVRLLLNHGANPELADTKGRKACDYAASAAKNASGIMKLLNHREE